MSQNEIDILKRAILREKASRQAAEKILEDKSRELYYISEKLREANAKLENLLDEKSNQLQGVFENIIDAYFVSDMEGGVLKLNDPAIALLGYDINKEELNVIDVIYKKDYKYALKSFYKLNEKGSFEGFASRIITKKKEIKWVYINASIVYNKNNKAIAVQGIVRDITEEKKARESTEEQKKQLDIIVDNAPFGIILTQNGNTRKTNKAFQNLLGYSEKDFMKLTMKDLSFPGDYIKSKMFIEKMHSGEVDTFTIKKRYKKKDGSIIWAKTNVNAVRDSKGKIRYQVAIVEDITSKREKTLIFEMINNLTKSILGKVDLYDISKEITNNIAQFLGSEDCVIYLVNSKNNTLEQIAAYGEKVNDKMEVKNKMIIPTGKGIVGRVAQTGLAEINNDTSKESEYVIDDKKRFSEITVPIYSGGDVIGVIDSEHTDKNYYTEAHLKMIKNVASLVSMQLKSAIDYRERLKTEAKNTALLVELEKSNEELKEYAHIVSHDLKSPLRSIDALVNWIKEDNKGNLSEMSLQNFSHIETTLEKMEQLISDVLEYSSLGANINMKEPVNINILVNDLINTLYIPEHIEVVVLNELPIIKVNKIKLLQLFQNLISNAVKFIDKEKGVIEIDVLNKKNEYQFSIKDNGIGIEEKYHKKIFKIFHSLNSGKESTGIGLSIVKKIIDLHNGKIWLESELNQGTTFYFTIGK